MKKRLYFLCVVFAVAFAATPHPLQAQQSRGAFIEAVDGEGAPFAARVELDRPDSTYAKNDLLNAKVVSSGDGFLYLFYRDAEGNFSTLFPNRFQTDNKIKAAEVVQVPPRQKATFKIRIDAPFGEETLMVAVTKKPIEAYANGNFSPGGPTPINDAMMKNLIEEFKTIPDSEKASHAVPIKTIVAREGHARPEGPRRFAVCIGVNEYRNDHRRPQGKKMSAVRFINDANRAKEFFLKHCDVPKENLFLITGKDANATNIRSVIRDRLPGLTRPGDIVFITWSGHGAQNERTKRVYLVTYDDGGEDSYVSSETFRQWIQCLDGRKNLLAFGSCHSAGMTTDPKKPESDESDEEAWQPYFFMIDQLEILKQINQKDTTVICACERDVSSYASPAVSGSRIELPSNIFEKALLGTGENAERPLSHREWFELTKKRVKEESENARRLVREHTGQNISFYQKTMWQDNLTEPLAVKP